MRERGRSEPRASPGFHRLPTVNIFVKRPTYEVLQSSKCSSGNGTSSADLDRTQSPPAPAFTGQETQQRNRCRAVGGAYPDSSDPGE